MISKAWWLAGAVLLSGCVQQTYSGKDQLVTPGIDAESASRERLSLGMAYLKRGNGEQAKYNFERALLHTPTDSDALLAMAYYYESVRAFDRAESYYQKSVEATPFNADAANNFGAFLCRQHKYQQADQWFNRAVSAPGYIRVSQTFENLGLCAEQAGWADKAASYYVQALNYNPRRATSLLQLAKLRFDGELLADSRSYLERYHQSGQQSADSLWLGAELEFAANNTDAARRYGVLLLAKFPASTQAKAYRTKYY
ncbi:type IV pilus biogenesis/stability protein PilW [Ferrimonas senticii]|uniref:type IV pilus biogenesis/stability protein PilW n=1 Tax=Ferrimonas senticii TaxID=394566 RepID=UPI00042359B4|nr:type IV pilus biogenesis/stability protein PilW [Ferrimonas senticii]